MICYHAMGTTDDTEPMLKVDDVEVGPNVLFHNNIWAVELRSYSDDEGRSSYVGVIGNDEEAVVTRWKAVVDGWSCDSLEAPSLRQRLWGDA